ncbi:sugar phosphate isomerase/epimerase family protein [Ruania zhangjianzhongii]|uniref:sugar phosphate isomerase/epimerase family protein n=1 Tax=Ruania zhangjianzhongii TaxID=2603206 RepID=UPI0011C92AFE|nr:sugar phosphate isomerase/epimerase family protein [Ruania zhangjianzhongii]
MTLRLSYGTNGFGDHRLSDALAIIADLGYDGVALTLDHHHLDPFAVDVATQVGTIDRLLTTHGLAVVIETGARYLLDPRRKHEPTLVSAHGRELRLDFLHRAIDIAADLGSDIVHFWSGTLPAGTSIDTGWDRLLTGMAEILPHAESAGVRLAVEPEPGMLIERLADAQELRMRLGSPDALRLTLDVGHALCNEDLTPDAAIRAAAGDLIHVQIEDMRRGVHEHLEFGDGELDLDRSVEALLEVRYAGLVSVELARHSHAAPVTAARSIDALRTAVASCESRLATTQEPR